MTASETASLTALLRLGAEHLDESDPVLAGHLEREIARQKRVLSMVASSSVVDPTVLAAQAAPAVNVTAEGYPGARYHAGCEVIDEIESLAIERAKKAFGAAYANVQVHSATTANQLVMCSLLEPGDVILGMDLDAGGHLTHGAPPTLSGQYFEAYGYGLDPEGGLDYDEVARLARTHRPKLLICGTTAYPRQLDFARFRAIADDVGAWLLADVTHIAGLIAAGLHPSSIDHAHVTTTCTHKQLYGPRGGLILSGRDHGRTSPKSGRNLAQHLQSAVFPFFQGAPDLGSIAGKAVAFGRLETAEFHALAERIVADARALAEGLGAAGWKLITGGTDNHLLVVEVAPAGLTGCIAEGALERCGIVVNKNRVPGDRHPPSVASGIRLGTNTLARRGMGVEQMERCVELIDRVLRAVEPRGLRRFELDERLVRRVRLEVEALCAEFPLDCYGVTENPSGNGAARHEESDSARSRTAPRTDRA
ncbi:MAG: serine hydroxymethyltransferase [Thermoanaerobaculia bacterium]|nr:serine hydroxymethyltransferase [Thermoanaerobaculia bacterium]